MIITELHETGSNKYIVGFSDGSDLKISFDIIYDFSLYKGRELTENEISEIKSRIDSSSCKERALRIIAKRPMSCRELIDRLIEKGETPEIAQDCVKWLLEMHYLDDEQYAGMVVRHYASKGYGIRRIKDELYKRKVPKEIWDEALSEMPENADEVYEQLCRKLKSDNPDRLELKKATDALFRRGFSWDEIKIAVNRLNCKNSDY